MKELITFNRSLKPRKIKETTLVIITTEAQKDILEALKPLLKQEECALTITDEVVLIGSRTISRQQLQ